MKTVCVWGGTAICVTFTPSSLVASSSSGMASWLGLAVGVGVGVGLRFGLVLVLVLGFGIDLGLRGLEQIHNVACVLDYFKGDLDGDVPVRRGAHVRLCRLAEPARPVRGRESLPARARVRRLAEPASGVEGGDGDGDPLLRYLVRDGVGVEVGARARGRSNLRGRGREG